VAQKDIVYYVLECEVRGVEAEFHLNDVPVIRRGQDIGRFYSGQCNHLLVDGVNELAVLVRPGPEPALALAGGADGRRPAVLQDKEGPATLSASLCRYPFGAVAGGPDREELMRLDWTARVDGRPQMFPLAVAAHQDLGPLFGRWQWQDAPQVALDEADRAAVRTLLLELHMALQAGDPEPFLELSAVRLEEAERAFGLAPGSKAAHIRKVTEQEAQEEWWGMQVLQPADFALRLCGPGRLVECVARDWLPILREKPDMEGGFSTYSMFLARLDGQWRIVR
jgi:hypothetical protein